MSVNQIYVLIAAVLVALVVIVFLAQRPSTAERCHQILYERGVARAGGAPPRPSDEAWYAEHCHQGAPR